jgi:hypothetical protein
VRCRRGGRSIGEDSSDAPNENTFYAPRRFQNFFL